MQSAFWQFQTITYFECCLIILLPYILFEKYIYILATGMVSPGKQHCANCIGTLSFAMRQQHKYYAGHVRSRSRKGTVWCLSVRLAARDRGRHVLCTGVVVIAAMNNNVVYPADNPPGYSQVPPSPSRPSPGAPYGQSTLLHNDGKQSQPGPAPQSAWNDPNQPQAAGYPQYPPPQPQPGCDPYGQSMAAPYYPRT